jgi:hypothetical protein
VKDQQANALRTHSVPTSSLALCTAGTSADRFEHIQQIYESDLADLLARGSRLPARLLVALMKSQTGCVGAA